MLPGLNAIKSHRRFCDAIVEHSAPDRPLRGYRLWKWRAAYSYYSGRSVVSLPGTTELRDYWERPDRVFLIVERGKMDEVQSVVGVIEPLVARAVGSNFVYLLTNRENYRGP